jgi:hypothetical protein
MRISRPERGEGMGDRESNIMIFKIPTVYQILSYWGDKIKGDTLCRVCSMHGMGLMESSYNILAGKPEEKRSLGRPSCRCWDNIKLILNN